MVAAEQWVAGFWRRDGQPAGAGAAGLPAVAAAALARVLRGPAGGGAGGSGKSSAEDAANETIRGRIVILPKPEKKDGVKTTPLRGAGEDVKRRRDVKPAKDVKPKKEDAKVEKLRAKVKKGDVVGEALVKVETSIAEWKKQEQDKAAPSVNGKESQGVPARTRTPGRWKFDLTK